MLSGVSLLIMVLAAGFSYGYVFDQLIDKANPDATLYSLQNDTPLFFSGISGWLLILITDLLVAWGLYHFFKKVDRQISLIAGLLRGLYALVLAIAIYQLIAVWKMLGNPNTEADALFLHIELFENYWSYGLIIFGLHLIGIGCLSVKSGMVPKWMGILLWIAGASYSIIHGAKAIFPNATQIISNIEMIMGAPMAIAEIGLAIWLILKGGKAKINLKK